MKRFNHQKKDGQEEIINTNEKNKQTNNKKKAKKFTLEAQWCREYIKVGYSDVKNINETRTNSITEAYIYQLQGILDNPSPLSRREKVTDLKSDGLTNN